MPDLTPIQDVNRSLGREIASLKKQLRRFKTFQESNEFKVLQSRQAIRRSKRERNLKQGVIGNPKERTSRAPTALDDLDTLIRILKDPIDV